MALDFYIQDGMCHIICAGTNVISTLAKRKEAMGILIGLQQSRSVGYALVYTLESEVITLDAKYAAKLEEKGMLKVEAPEQNFASGIAKSLAFQPKKYEPSKLRPVVTIDLERKGPSVGF